MVVQCTMYNTSSFGYKGNYWNRYYQLNIFYLIICHLVFLVQHQWSIIISNKWELFNRNRCFSAIKQSHKNNHQNNSALDNDITFKWLFSLQVEFAYLMKNEEGTSSLSNIHEWKLKSHLVIIINYICVFMVNN